LEELINERIHNGGDEKIHMKALTVRDKINQLPCIAYAIDCITYPTEPKTLGIFENIHAYIKNYDLIITDKTKPETNTLVYRDYLIFGFEDDALGLTIFMGDGNDINIRMILD